MWGKEGEQQDKFHVNKARMICNKTTSCYIAQYPANDRRHGIVATPTHSCVSSILVQLVAGNFEMEAVTEQLKQLTLADVVETGRELGSGAYGKVVEVRLSGLKCAGKKLHAVFFDKSPPEGQQAILSRFVEECVR